MGMHGDLEVIEMLTIGRHTNIDDVASPASKDTHVVEHPEHHNHVHPLVATLRDSCAAEFERGVCGFALAERVCPRKLLNCLVTNRNTLGPRCLDMTRQQLTTIAQSHDYTRMLCSIFTWFITLLAVMLLCSCCCKAIARCCRVQATDPGPLHKQYSEVTVIKTPASAAAASAPVDVEEAELEMALVLSAAEAGMSTTVVDGIPAKEAQD